MYQIDVLLSEDRLAEEFLAALDRRYLPEKFFYWFPLSVKAWLDLCREAQPYRNHARSFELVSRHAAEIAGRLPGSSLEVVSLGAGQGDKDLLCLEAIRDGGRAAIYRPVDSSQALLEMAVERAAGAGFTARGLKADLADPRTVEALSAPADRPRLYLVLGNTLGAIDPLEFLSILKSLVRPEDRLLLDAEIFNPRDTLPGYDNPVNRRFAFAPLASVGVEEGRDGTLEFAIRPDARRAGLHPVAKRFRALRPLRIPVAGRWIAVEDAEEIAMSSSWKYSRPAFLEILGDAGGFRSLGEYLSRDERFLLVLVARAVSRS